MGGRGEMIKPPTIGKTWGRGSLPGRSPTSTGPGGVGTGLRSRKRCWPRGPITPGEKSSGKRSAGNPPAPFDEAGAGDVAMGAGLRPKAKGLDKPPDPTVRAPVLDPTEEGGGSAVHLLASARNTQAP